MTVSQNSRTFATTPNGTTSLERRRFLIYAGLMVAEVSILVGSYLLVGWLYFGQFPANAAIMLLRVIAPLYLVIAAYQQVYSIKAISDPRFAVSQIAGAALTALGLTLLLTFWAKIVGDFSRLTFTIGSLFAFLLIVALRRAVIAAVRKRFGPYAMNILVIRDGGPEFSVPGAFELDAEQAGLKADLKDPEALNRFGHHVKNMDRVIIATKSDKQNHWAFLLRATGVRAEIITKKIQELGALGLRRDGKDTFLVVSTGPMGLRSRILKRVFDLAITVPAMIVAMPIFAAVAIAIKLEDGGPLFFYQPRVGKNNRLFNVHKFRSMSVEGTDTAGNRSASKDDDRITRVGRFIRKTSLDELPQLLNVVKGDMSLVGPRPHALGSRAGDKLFWEVDPEYWIRHSLKPGITGLAQVRGFRGATHHEDDLRDRLKADLEYLRGWTLLRDIEILFRTVTVLIHDRAF